MNAIMMPNSTLAGHSVPTEGLAVMFVTFAAEGADVILRYRRVVQMHHVQSAGRRIT
jgi:hypothetical protein